MGFTGVLAVITGPVFYNKFPQSLVASPQTLTIVEGVATTLTTTHTPPMNLTAEQTAAIKNALALYNLRIARIQDGISIDTSYSMYKTIAGKPTAEAVRAASRVKSGEALLDKLFAERNALALAFGITL